MQHQKKQLQEPQMWPPAPSLTLNIILCACISRNLVATAVAALPTHSLWLKDKESDHTAAQNVLVAHFLYCTPHSEHHWNANKLIHLKMTTCGILSQERAIQGSRSVFDGIYFCSHGRVRETALAEGNCWTLFKQKPFKGAGRACGPTWAERREGGRGFRWVWV